MSLSADSDYRYRGVSLSDDKPDVSLNLTYDHASGAYAGASIIGDQNRRDGVQLLGYFDYVGYAARVRPGLAWDVGLTTARIVDDGAGPASPSRTPSGDYVDPLPYDPPTAPKVFNYNEAYLGLIGDHLSARVYYSPDYLGEGLSTVYLDLNGAVRPAPGWRVFGHVGALTPINGPSFGDNRYERFDLRGGVAAELKSCEFELAWTTSRPGQGYMAVYTQRRDELVLSASYFF